MNFFKGTCILAFVVGMSFFYSHIKSVPQYRVVASMDKNVTFKYDANFKF